MTPRTPRRRPPHLRLIPRPGGEPGRKTGAYQQPEGDGREDVAVFLVRLGGMDEQDHGDEQQQESVAAQVGQRPDQVKMPSPPLGPRNPQQVLVSGTAPAALASLSPRLAR